MNTVLIIWTCMLLVIYAAFIFWQWYGWKRTIAFTFDEHYVPSVKVSVIVPVRNEEKNIPALLDGLISQDYPAHLLEIIVADDDSTDRTQMLVRQYQPRVILVVSDNPEDRLHKKRALETAVKMASGELIMTTDADCTHPEKWVKTIAAFYEQYKPSMILAPVVFKKATSAGYHFQQLEFSALMMTTAAAVHSGHPFLANGANLAYPRKIFEEVNGYAGDLLNSGDDISLLNKIRKKYKSDKIQFIRSPDAIVETEPVDTWKQLIHQRVRWASKSMVNKDAFSAITGMIIVLYAASLLFLTGLLFFHPAWFYLPLILAGFKIAADSCIFYTWSAFRKKRVSFFHILLSEMLYPPYLFWVTCRSISGKYEWKGRAVKR